MKKKISNISIIIPVLNEENNITYLLEELTLNLRNKINFEILVVDDGSTDNTVKNTLNLLKASQNISLLVHKKNYGQSASLLTGITNAKYEHIVTIDGDGQNDPKDILKLVKNYNNNSAFFLVIGNRKKRNDKFARRLASRFAFLVRNIILGDKVPDTGCGLKVFKKSDFLFIPFFNHIHRFLPFLFSSMGGNILSVNINHRERKSGISKYSNLQRGLAGIFDLFGVIWLRKRTHSSILIKQLYSSKKNKR